MHLENGRPIRRGVQAINPQMVVTKLMTVEIKLFQ